MLTFLALAHMLDATQDAGLGCMGGMLTFLALAHMLDATPDAGLGWGGCDRSLHLHTCWMLRKMLGWGDVNVPCPCTHVGCYARCWVGVGGMLKFLAFAHMLDATQDAGWGGGMLTFLAFAHMLDATQDAGWGGGMLTFLALAHMLDATQDAGLGWGGC